MVLKIIITFLIVAVIAFIINYFERKLNRERNKISIKESLDLTRIPIVTLQEEDLKLNFILDSGSSDSHVSRSAAKEMLGTPIKTDYTYTTSIGSDDISKMIESVLRYKDKEFKINLLINKELDNSFERIKDDCGVQLHGILGADFLKEHKYVLDFSELVAYSK